MAADEFGGQIDEDSYLNDEFEETGSRLEDPNLISNTMNKTDRQDSLSYTKSFVDTTFKADEKPIRPDILNQGIVTKPQKKSQANKLKESLRQS